MVSKDFAEDELMEIFEKNKLRANKVLSNIESGLKEANDSVDSSIRLVQEFKKSRGRPLKEKNQQAHNQIQIRLTDEELSALQAIRPNFRPGQVLKQTVIKVIKEHQVGKFELP